MKRNPFLITLPICLLTLPFLLPVCTPALGKEVTDGLPFRAGEEFPNVEAAWNQLKSEPAADAETPGFIALSKQSRAYRGKRVQLEGRLLRIDEQSVSAKSESDSHISIFYEIWVLLSDEKRIPARLLVRELPPGLEPDSPDAPDAPLRRDRIAATGIYYRQAAYNGGDDFYNSPVIIADTFSVTARSAENSTEKASPWYWKAGALTVLLLLWIVIRFILIPRSRRTRVRFPLSAPETPGSDFQFQEDELQEMKDAADSRAEKSGKILPLLLLAFCFAGTVFADSEPATFRVDGTFWSEITPINTDALFQSRSETDPAFLENAQILLVRLHENISPGLLARSLAEPRSGGTFSFPDDFGVPFRFRGKVTAAAKTTLNKRADFPELETFVLTLETGSGTVTVYSPAVPKGWGNDGSKGIGETAEGIGILLEKYDDPILAAPRVGSAGGSGPLGRLGYDTSLFDTVSARSISELAQAGGNRQELLRQFRLNPSDRLPFYGLLTKTAELPAGTLKEAAKTETVSTVDLFNHPSETQGIPVTLTGHLRRAQKVLVTDGEISALYGIDHYYELYLFTAESQDYPILFCVPELPISESGKPMPVGSGEGYREEVTLTGFLYKPWAYRIDPANAQLAPGFLESDRETGKHWIAVPLMIGTDGVWNAEASDSAHPFSDGVFWLLGGFFFLVLLYLTARRKSKPLRFRIGQHPSHP